MKRLIPSFSCSGALLAVTIAMAPAGAQGSGDSVRVLIRRTPTGFEAEVEKVAREVALRRKLQLELARTLEILSRQFQAAAGDERPQAEQRLSQVRMQLTSVTREGAELSRRLRNLCNEERRPDGWVGVTIQSDLEFERGDDGAVTRRYRDYLTIVSVEPGSPAERAGVKAGDILMAIGTVDVRARDFDLSSLLKPGARLQLKIRRGVESRTIPVDITPRPEQASTPCPWIDDRIVSALAAPHEPAMVSMVAPASPRGAQGVIVTRAPEPNPREVAEAAPRPDPVTPLFVWSGSGIAGVAGAQLAPMNPDLAEVIGAEQGLLVIRVFPGTPADVSGLRGGDVIISADGVPLADALTLQRVVNRARARGEVPLVVVRKKRQQTLSLRL